VRSPPWHLALLVVASLALVPGCRRHHARHHDGHIVGSQPCTLAAPYGSWIAVLDADIRPEFASGHVLDALDAHPLTTLFPEAEYDGLRTDSEEGRCEEVTYTSDGLKIRGFVVRPAHAPGVKLPVVLYARGGNRAFGPIDTRLLLQMRRFARDGFVVLGTQYRGGPGSEGSDEFGGRDVDDLLALTQVAANVPDADPEHLFIYGGSRGGMMVSLALKRGLRVRAAAIRAGAFDPEDALVTRPDLAATVYSRLIPGYASDPHAALVSRSVLAWPEAVSAPLLMLHAREDWRVPLHESERLDGALARLGKQHRLVVFEGDVHQLYVHREDEAREVVAWFRAHQDGPP
jgi:dipeptidyl aminopeptidase/acylaminoacyl peptidase